MSNKFLINSIIVSVISSSIFISCEMFKTGYLSDSEFNKVLNEKSFEKIKAITDEQAKKLADFVGISIKLKDADRYGIDTFSFDGREEIQFVLPLNNLEKVTDKQIEYLSKSKALRLFLNSLDTISLNQAKILSQYEGTWLSLGGIKTLSDTLVKILRTFKCYHLDLNGIKSITDGQLKDLVESRRSGLRFDNINSFTIDQVKMLSSYGGDFLSLKGIETASDEFVEIISKYSGRGG